jgi:endonuclease/exonuclease/phosphatase family metal-dependent hydrolase
MSYNILHGSGMDGTFDLDRTAEVIRQANPGVVGLNEVDNNYGARSGFLNEAKQLAQILDMLYVYGPNLDRGGDKPSQYGNAILSRYPIKGWRNNKLYRHADDEQRGCLLAEIEITGSVYTFLATHLDHQSPQARIGQVKDILKMVEPIKEKIILMGDFNCESPRADRDKEHTLPIAMLTEILVDSFLVAGAGPGDTFDRAGRLDYIFVSDDLKDNIKGSKVIRTPLTAIASDHLPVIAEIRISTRSTTKTNKDDLTRVYKSRY